MKRAVLADTGPVYAAVDPDDEHHTRAQREIKQLTRDKREVILAYPTLLEAYTLVLYRLGKPAASMWLKDTLVGAALINPTPEDYREAATRLTDLADQPIRLFDATLGVLATRLGIEVWTYDHHFDVMHTVVWRSSA
jgi:predicted nucleic acid-binding protein